MPRFAAPLAILLFAAQARADLAAPPAAKTARVIIYGRVRVDGAPREGATVFVGDATVHTDARGRYRAEIARAPSIGVVVSDDGILCFEARFDGAVNDPVTLEPDGRRRYRVDFAIATGHPTMCGD